MIHPKDKRILFLVGPTASGKSSLSLEIAPRVGGEIVSADSRQVYRFMNIGTAKPTPAEQGRIRHHLIDILAPDAVFSAGEFGQRARAIVESIFSRGRTPIVVGGSGLYVRALADGIFSGNYRDPAIRERLKKIAETEGSEALYTRLSEMDPEAVRKIHPHDLKRIIRALEVREVSGQPISEVQKTKTDAGDFKPVFFGLDWPRAELYRRIENRVDEMLQNGLIREVEELEKMGYGPKLNACDSVGYKEVFQHLAGKLAFADLVPLIKQNTRRFAKRQMTWFRRDERIQWIPVSEPADWKGLAERIAGEFLGR